MMPGSQDHRRTRARVGHARADDVDVYIGRHGPDGTHDHIACLQGAIEIGDPGWLGNPYPAEEFGREPAIAMFTHTLLNTLDQRPRWRRILVERCRGRVLGCWCRRLDEEGPRCHGDVIARIVDDVIKTPDETADDDRLGGRRAMTDGGVVDSRSGTTSDLEQRIRELEQLREDLRRVAESEARYAVYARNALDELEAIDDE